MREPRPIASTTRSAASASPAVGADADDVRRGTARAGDAARRRRRRGGRSGRAAPRRRVASTCSSVARRPVSVAKRSSPGRGARSAIPGGMRSSALKRAAPAAANASSTSGSSASSTRRPRDCRKCVWWNWATPRRSHASQAASGGVGDGRRVAFEQGHGVAVAGEHEPGGEPAHPAAEHDDPWHALQTACGGAVFPPALLASARPCALLIALLLAAVRGRLRLHHGPGPARARRPRSCWTSSPTPCTRGSTSRRSAATTTPRAWSSRSRRPGASTDALKLLQAGRADMAILDIHDLGLAREQGRDIVGVMAFVQRPLAAVLAQPGIRSPKDARGQARRRHRPAVRRGGAALGRRGRRRRPRQGAHRPRSASRPSRRCWPGGSTARRRSGTPRASRSSASGRRSASSASTTTARRATRSSCSPSRARRSRTTSRWSGRRSARCSAATARRSAIPRAPSRRCSRSSRGSTRTRSPPSSTRSTRRSPRARRGSGSCARTCCGRGRGGTWSSGS